MAALFDVLLKGLRDTGLFAFSSDVSELRANAQWYGKAVGEVFFLWDHLPGVTAPPNNLSGRRFIKLTASDAYNSGLLANGVFTGSAPLITATADIALATSPLYGQTVHLINTERRFLRAGASGTAQDDALQNITGSFLRGGINDGSGAFSAGGSASGVGSGAQPNYYVNFDASLVARTANETRGRNVGATAYMRIL